MLKDGHDRDVVISTVLEELDCRLRLKTNGKTHYRLLIYLNYECREAELSEYALRGNSSRARNSHRIKANGCLT